MIQEEWRPVVGYEECYEVSDTGRIKSLMWRNGIDQRKSRKNPKILKQSKTTTGYFKVELSDGNGKRSLRIHRLVACAFVPNPLGLPCINHIDENQLNNRPENLEWCTQAYNVQYSQLLHRYQNKLSTEQEKDIISLYNAGSSTREISKGYPVVPITVYNILRRNNVEMRSISEAKDRYGVDLAYLKELIDAGFSNKEMAKIFECTAMLIATRRYQYKRGIIH